MANGTDGARLATRNFFALSSADAVSRIISAVSIVYLARVLGTETYGAVGFVAAIIVYFSIFVDFGIESVGPREIVQGPMKPEVLVPSIILFRLLLLGIALLIIVPLAMFFPDQRERILLLLYALTLFPVALQLRWVLVGFQKTSFLLLTLIISEATKLLFIIFLIAGQENVFRVPIVQFGGDFLGVLLLLWWTSRRFTSPIKIDWKATVSLFQRSKSILFAGLLALIIYNSDVLYLRFFREAEEVGLYLAAFALINFLGQLGNNVRLTLLPAFSQVSEQDRMLLFKRATFRVLLLSIVIAVPCYALARVLVLYLFGESYAESVLLFQILIWSIPLFYFRSMLQAVLIAGHAEASVFRMTAVTAILTLVVNLWMIPRYGAIGAAITTVAAELIRMCLAYFYVRRRIIQSLR